MSRMMDAVIATLEANPQTGNALLDNMDNWIPFRDAVRHADGQGLAAEFFASFITDVQAGKNVLEAIEFAHRE